MKQQSANDQVRYGLAHTLPRAETEAPEVSSRDRIVLQKARRSVSHGIRAPIWVSLLQRERVDDEVGACGEEIASHNAPSGCRLRNPEGGQRPQAGPFGDASAKETNGGSLDIPRRHSDSSPTPAVWPRSPGEDAHTHPRARRGKSSSVR